jgi:AAA-like domain
MNWRGRSATKEDKPGRGRRPSSAPDSGRTRPEAWQLKAVVNHVTFAGDRMIAWYLADPQTWSFRSVAEGEALIRDQAAQLAELVGNTVHGRVTSRPYPVSHWARAAYANAPEPQEGFDEMMRRDQVHMSRHGQADKLVFYGVDLGSRSAAVKILTKVLSGAADRELQVLQERLDIVDTIMGAPGFEAVPALGKDIEWLLARSFALGCPVPVPGPDEGALDRLDSDDLVEFTSAVHWEAEPLAPTLQVTTSVSGRQVTRHVCVLTLSRIGEIAIPEQHEPWMAKVDRLGFPVEWSFRVIPRSPEEVSKEMTKLSNRIDAQMTHWSEDHDKRPPKQLARQAARAADVEDEMRSEFTGLLTRTMGWYRIAVSGQSEALDRAQRVVDLYKPQIKWVRQLGQYYLAREFVPGEPLATTAHARKFPVLKVAAGLPAITAEVGDRRGFHIGETAGLTSRAVCVDPWFLPEVMESSGLVPIIGTLGSGKSYLSGVIIAKAILAGVRGVAMDPAGRLQKLLQLPEIAAVARSVNVLGGHPGSLSPYGVVPTPNQDLVRLGCDDPTDEDEFEEKLRLAHAAAMASRRDLAISTLRWCLPISMSRNDEVQNRLRAAVMTAPAERTSQLNNVQAILTAGDGTDQAIARELAAAGERELGRLFFSTETQSRHDIERLRGDAPVRFTFFNLKGLTTPDERVPMEDWRADELLAKPIMTLAAWSSLNEIYRSDPHERKLFSLDESKEVIETAGGAGRALVYKLSSDSRKNNCVALVAAQNASTVLGTDITNFVGAAFVGRTQSESAQRDALKVLGKPEGVGYEEILANLSGRSRREEERLGYREFIYRDGLGGESGRGGMEKIRVTVQHHPELAAALDTTADPTKRIRVLREQSDPDSGRGVA